MSFFTLSSGEPIESINSFENGGRQEIIPTGTQLLCDIVGAKWAESDGYNSRHIVIDLLVVQSGRYQYYTVKHKLHVNDLTDKKKDKALQMLMAYDTLCKGYLVKADAAGKEITDAVLAKALVGGEVVATFDVWETERADGTTMSGNWVRAIGPKSKLEQAKDKQVMAKAKQVAEESGTDDFDDEIPF